MPQTPRRPCMRGSWMGQAEPHQPSLSPAPPVHPDSQVRAPGLLPGPPPLLSASGGPTGPASHLVVQARSSRPCLPGSAAESAGVGEGRAGFSQPHQSDCIEPPGALSQHSLCKAAHCSQAQTHNQAAINGDDHLQKARWFRNRVLYRSKRRCAYISCFSSITSSQEFRYT